MTRPTSHGPGYGDETGHGAKDSISFNTDDGIGYGHGHGTCHGYSTGAGRGGHGAKDGTALGDGPGSVTSAVSGAASCSGGTW